MSAQKNGHSPPDADTGELRAASSNGKDAQEDALIALWIKIKRLVESSEKTPGRVVPRVLDYLRASIPVSAPGAQEARNSVTDILPEEMWCEILIYITAPDDLLSCFRACRLFHTELKKRVPQKLFGAVLPNVAKHLNQREILKCRFVCRQWDKGVCSFFELKINRFRVLRPPQNEPVASDLAVGNYLHQLTINAQAHSTDQPYLYLRRYKFRIPNTDTPPHKHENQTKMLLNPRNPFVGGVLEVSKTPVLGEPSFPTLVDNLLTHLGTYLTSLTLNEMDVSNLDEYIDLWSVIVCIFKSCPKLKWFILRYRFCPPKKQKVDPAALELNALPDHSAIRYINIGGEEHETISYQLFSKYSNQLYLLDLSRCNLQFFSNLTWENLTMIKLGDHLSEDTTAALRRFEAPQLRHLHSWISRREYRTTFTNILETVNSFPRLTTLQMNFGYGAGVGPDPEEILSTSANLICRSNITSLELVVPEGTISYDFLVCFPFIRNLALHVHFPSHRRVTREKNKGKAAAIGPRSNELLQQQINHLLTNDKDEPTPGPSTKNAGNAPRRSENALKKFYGRIVHLNQFVVKLFFGDDPAEANVCLYESNIWEILPFLQTLTVTTGSGNYSRDPDKVFTRRGYQNRERN